MFFASTSMTLRNRHTAKRQLGPDLGPQFLGAN